MHFFPPLIESISADDRYLLLQRHGEFVELDPQAPFGPDSSCLDELLTAVDVEGGAGDGGVRHEMDGEGGDVGRGDDAAHGVTRFQRQSGRTFIRPLARPASAARAQCVSRNDRGSITYIFFFAAFFFFFCIVILLVLRSGEASVSACLTGTPASHAAQQRNFKRL